MSDEILPGLGTHGITEFQKDPKTGKVYNGTCTQTALEVCIAGAEKRAPNGDEVVRITEDMIAKNLCSANGAATLWAVAKEARDLGHHVALEWDYGQLGDWHKALLDNAGLRPILLQVANGNALIDAQTGKRNEAGARGALHYHAIAIVGKGDLGYDCADGDHPEVISRWQTYTYQTLVAAQPCGLMILNLEYVTPPSTSAPPAPDYKALYEAELAKNLAAKAALG